MNKDLENKVRLYVPFQEKELVKNLGALWDNSSKYWFTFEDKKENFLQWLSPKEKKIELNEALNDFKKALEEQGLIIDDLIVDGKLHRVPVVDDNVHKKSGAYLVHIDNKVSGFIQNFKTGYKSNWNSKNINSLNNSEIIYASSKPKINFEEENLKTSTILENEFNNAKWAYNQHPYLVKKGFEKNYFLKQDEFGNLLVPLKDVDGKFWSSQRIFPSGDKMIGQLLTKEEKEAGIKHLAKKQGCFHIIGAKQIDNVKEIIICEGFATAVSIHEAIKKPVVMGIDIYNIENLVKIFKDKFPDKNIIIAPDNDKKQELKGKENIGKITALKLKDEYKVKVILPNLTEQEVKEGYSDFNDIHKSRGLNEIKKQFFFVLAKDKEKDFSKELIR